jgi:ComF family protein
MKNYFQEVVIFFRSLINLTSHWILPNYCFVCNDIQQDRSECLCEQCWKKLKKNTMNNWIQEVQNSTHLSGAFSGWKFDDTFQSLIHELKYNGYAKTGRYLGKQMGARFKNSLPQMDCLIPVPLHKVKKRDRGFNQSCWIAKGLASELKIPVETTILKRIKYTQSQTTLSKKERQLNMAEAFEVRQTGNFKSVGLVDDVLTTGSTADACGAILLKNGFEKIYILSLAKTFSK